MFAFYEGVTNSGASNAFYMPYPRAKES